MWLAAAAPISGGAMQQCVQRQSVQRGAGQGSALMGRGAGEGLFLSF